MKAKVLAISVLFVFLMIGFSGCETLEEELDKLNYINVEVELSVKIFTSEFYSFENISQTYWISDALVKGEMVKSSGGKEYQIL